MARRPAERKHPQLHSVLVDLPIPRRTAEAAAEAAVRFPFTTVVHNAGVIKPALLPDVKLPDLQLTHIHLSSAITIVQHALPAMHAAGFRRIILMSSRCAGSADPDDLRGDQGRHDGHGPHLGAGAGLQRHHRQRGGARTDPDRHVLDVVPPGSERNGRSPRACRCAASVGPTTWRVR
jgi:hypothetical protein